VAEFDCPKLSDQITTKFVGKLDERFAKCQWKVQTYTQSKQKPQHFTLKAKSRERYRNLI